MSFWLRDISFQAVDLLGEFCPGEDVLVTVILAPMLEIKIGFLRWLPFQAAGLIQEADHRVAIFLIAFQGLHHTGRAGKIAVLDQALYLEQP